MSPPDHSTEISAAWDAWWPRDLASEAEALAQGQPYSSQPDFTSFEAGYEAAVGTAELSIKILEGAVSAWEKQNTMAYERGLKAGAAQHHQGD